MTAGSATSLGSERPDLFLWVCIVYFAAGVAIVVGGRRLMPNLRATTFVHASVDALAISLLLFSSGGVASGLGILFVVPVGAMALLADSRDAFLRSEEHTSELQSRGLISYAALSLTKD